MKTVEITLMIDGVDVMLSPSEQKMGGTLLMLTERGEGGGQATVDLHDHEVRKLIRLLEAMCGRLS